jgi:bifunctional DNA-binding transcriptional regulator/antitoxin component of YhaV-PrlF toxin-antitoxin module
MTTLTVTAKGQVTLRKDVLTHLGISPGQKVEVSLLPGGRAEVRAVKKGSIEKAFGLLKREGQRALTMDEINEAIAEGWSGKR